MSRLFLIAFVSVCATTHAGIRMDLRPTPPVPPGGYQPNSNVNINVFLVDTGNPQGAISFRGMFLDFTDSSPVGGPNGLEFLGGSLESSWDDDSFGWINPFSIGAVFPSLPQVSWVYPLSTPNPLFQTTMPNDGEIQIGNIYVNIGADGGTIDVMNDDVADPNFGARVDFGFGGAGDPVTTWRAFNGDVTGGVLQLPVVPEPGTVMLLVTGCFALICRRSRART